MNKLPQNLQAEAGSLGIILNNNSKISQVISSLKIEDFYSTRHQFIFRTMCDLYKNDIEISVLTLSDRIGNGLKDVGGVTYLSKLLSSFMGYEDINSYIKIIKEKARLRKIIIMSYNAQKMAYSEEKTSKNIADMVEQGLYNIYTEKENKMAHISDIVEDSFKKLEDNYGKKGELLGISTGYKELNIATGGMQKGEFIIVAARPSMGKTAFGLNLIMNIVKNNGSAAVFSIEMSKFQIMQRIFSFTALIPYQNIRKASINDKEWVELAKCSSALGDKNLFIDDTSDITVSEIRAKCKALKLKYNLDVVLIDYIGLINAKAENRQQEISTITRELKNMAKDLDITVIALSQLNRAVEQRADHRPMLSDLRESGLIEQDGDVVMFLYRDEYYNMDSKDRGKLECIVAKNRNGRVGSFKMGWIPQYQRVVQLV
ncbi:replicative DNA helicase [Clostridium ganghwense]|uniref:Replicative DNA helicase n=1 Tax=Clostridium ganghwense TaxID=312089 RepID=A0ABT4CT58_9CLOT|nr:replicative DNA helicase [Clostridium ganghwense]MCY6372234.1 replicative DNA helicase [Clostridium ganghwense]